jgi:F-type H+-transporting ATPase subunit delta
VKNLAIARRYAKALLLIGKEDGKTDTYREELGALQTWSSRKRSLQQVLVNPLYDADGRKKVLTRVMKRSETVSGHDHISPFSVR